VKVADDIMQQMENGRVEKVVEVDVRLTIVPTRQIEV
jgi:hypothetical protein